jgi:chorismate dehydratase
MILLGKIDFINLLPFDIYIKKHIKSSRLKQSINYKKSYPAYINQQFKRKKIDGAFISSVVSAHQKCFDVGIVAKKNVNSVLLKAGNHKNDYQSNTSNILAKVLGLQGNVIIGDKALKLYYNSNDSYIDLALAWYQTYKLPFVFARFCINSHDKYFITLLQNFLKSNTKIPQYILKKYATKHHLTTKQIKDYLNLISYQIGYKEKKSLKLFLKLSKDIKYDR